MSQILSQSLGQHMRMEQRLTPQLIQSMSILQKPVAELEAYIADALETNAALEIAEPQATQPETDEAASANGKVQADHREDAGDHVGRQPRAQGAPQLFDERGRAVAGRRDHEGDQTPVVVAERADHDCGVGRPRLLPDHSLHLPELDAVAPDLDLRVAATEELERAIGAVPYQVAGPVQPVSGARSSRAARPTSAAM